MIKKDEELVPDRAVIVQIEPEKRPYPFSSPEEDLPTEREEDDFDYSDFNSVSSFNENDKNGINPVSIPKPGYNLSHCKEGDLDWYIKI